MRKDRTCCDGECRQGRQCPLYDPQPEPERVSKSQAMVLGAGFCVIVLLLLASFT